MTDQTRPEASPPAAPSAPAPRRDRPRRGLLFPLVLVVLGAALLAGNLGYLAPISARALFDLWPVLLILAGIEVALGRRQPWVALVIEILVIAAALGLAIAQPRIVPQGEETTAATVGRAGASALSLRVDGGAGTYTIAGGGSALVEARSEGGEIVVTDERRSDTANVRISPPQLGDSLFLHRSPTRVDVRVASGVPTSLAMSSGAGEFDVDLSAVTLRDATLETGASKLTVTLPRPTGDVRIRIEAGAASIDVVVPDGVEVRVTTTGGLLSTNVRNPRLSGGGGGGIAVDRVAETAGYASATDRVTVTIEAGASSITIR